MSSKAPSQNHSGNYVKYKSTNIFRQLCISRFIKELECILHGFSLKDHTQMSILDAGCGEGFLIRLLQQAYPQAKITGLDYSAAALEYARSNNSTDVYFLEGDITKLPFDNSAFDIVICTEVLEHLTAPEAALSEVLRVSKRYTITVPHEPWFCIGNLLALKNIKRFGNPIDHINHWTLRSFKAFLSKQTDVSHSVFTTSFPWIICVLDVR